MPDGTAPVPMQEEEQQQPQVGPAGAEQPPRDASPNPAPPRAGGRRPKRGREKQGKSRGKGPAGGGSPGVLDQYGALVASSVRNLSATNRQRLKRGLEEKLREFKKLPASSRFVRHRCKVIQRILQLLGLDECVRASAARPRQKFDPRPEPPPLTPLTPLTPSRAAGRARRTSGRSSPCS